MSFFSKTTSRFDVAVAITGAFLAVFKAFDTAQNYKREQAVINNMPPAVRKGYDNLKGKKK